MTNHRRIRTSTSSQEGGMMKHQRIRTSTRRHTRFLGLLVAVSLLVGMLGPAPVAHADPGATVDDGPVSVVSSSASVSTINVSHTTGTGENRLMLVGVSWNSGTSARTISTVTFTPDGGEAVALAVVISQKHGVAANYRYAAIYSLLDPPSGQAGTVAVNFSGSFTTGVVVGVANFAGVDQTTPLGVSNGAYSPSNNTTPTVTLTGLDGDELVLDTLFLGGNPPAAVTVGADQTVVTDGVTTWDMNIANARGAASTEQATGGSVTMSWTAASSSMWVTVAVAIHPAPAGPTHDLTTAVNPSGGGTTDPPEGLHSYAEGSVVDITATPNEGYEFNHWGDACSGTDPNDCQVTMDGDKTVTAYFTALPQYTLTVSTTGTGTVTLDPAGGTYYSGTTVTLTPVPGACYEFGGWSGADASDIVDTGGIYTILMDGDKSVTADFAALPQYTLTASDDGHGSVTLDPVGGTYCTGTTVTLTPVPDSGYIFSSWSGADASDIVDTGGIYTILMDGDKSVTANFGVALWPTLDGAVSSGTGLPTESSVSFSHTTGTGTNRLMLVGVSWNCGTTDRTISSITFTPDGGLALSLTEVKTQLYNWSSNYRYTAIYSLLSPDSGVPGTVHIAFSGAVSNGIIAGAANFAGVDQTTPLGTPDGAVGTGNNSSGTPNPAVTLTGLGGDELVFDSVFIGVSSTSHAITADSGQSELWNVSGYSLSTSFNGLGAASTKEATGTSATMSWTTVNFGSTTTRWAIAAVPINPGPAGPTHDLTVAVDPSGGGTTDPAEGVYSYAEGSVVDITATPNEGYVFSSWSGDCSGTDPDVCQVTMDQDRSVTANFAALPQYTLAVGTTGDGSVTLDPAGGTYYEGTTVTLTPVPGPCYTFDGWSGPDSANIQGTGPYTILMDGNKSVTADFGALPQYTLTAGDDGNGSVTLDPAGGTYCTGTTVTLTPVPDSGYVFSSWSGADASDIVDTGGIYTILMNGNKSVTANFAESTFVTLDGAVSSGTADDVSSIDVAHTTGTGPNRLILVGVSWNCYNTDQSISSVTFTPSGGSAVSLNEVKTQQAGTQLRYAAIYSLLNPPSGVSGTVTITFSGSVGSGTVAGVANFAGVDQTTPLGTPDGAGSGTNDTAPTVTLTGLSGDELVFDDVFQGASGETQTLTVGAGQTALWNAWIANTRAAASTEQAAGSSVTMSWTASSASYWAIAAVPINPAPVVAHYDLTIAVDPVAGGTTDPAVGVHTYEEDDVVDITATPAVGYEFDHWSGDCTGSGACQVTMDEDKSVTAHFEESVASGSATSSAVPSDATPTVGAQIDVDISIDVTNVDAPDDALGSFTGSLDWDPDVLAYNSNSGLLAGFTGAINTAAVGTGHIAFNGLNAYGPTGNTMVFTIIFDVIGAGTSDLDLEYSAMAAAYTFVDLTPILTVNDGSVVATLAEYTLTMAVDPGEGGTTDPAVGDHAYAAGTLVNITATPAVGYEFHEWSGACTGSGACQVTMNADKSVTAHFTAITHELTIGVDPVGGGTTSPVVGVHTYGYGTVVDITALPNSGYEFYEWSGACTGSGACQVTMDADRNVTAHFTAITHELTIGVDPVGGGTTSPAAGVHTYGYGTVVDITATPAVGYEFYEWSGACTGSGACQVTMDADKSVTAHFTTITYELTIGVDPVGGGTTSPAVGVHTYGYGTVVDITAAPAAGYVFDQWSGDCSGPGTCSVTMDGPKSVTAHFTLAPGLLGDVNDDDVVNSTDALIVLSCDAGFDTSQYCPMNCGDVNSDGLVNSTDALIILSYDAEISVPYPVGEPGCPSSVTPCSGCGA
jgi:hypothetical protein